MISCLRHHWGRRRTSSCTPRIVLQRLDGFRTIVTSLAIHDSQLPRVGGFGRFGRSIVPERHRQALLPLQRRRENARAKRDRTDPVSSVWSLSTFGTGPATKGYQANAERSTISPSSSSLGLSPSTISSAGHLTSFVPPHPGTSCYRD